jgi:ABC-type polysaccharide/polyol phosphate transport system ATPase subunit
VIEPADSPAAAIAVSGVGKRYVKYDDEAMLATKRARLRRRTQRGHHWALRGLDLRVDPGQCLGVIGQNGSGKSTLLRMLAGVTAPTEGRVVVRGRVAPLIAVGVGFHPELTGRENVYVNGSILGVPRRVIDERFDDIVGFAGIETFIDTPVKFYSSGMFVRLGFGVSMFAEPDVLLVDEVLAVGDFSFQLKCFDRMAEVREQGTAIVVVSHNLNAIRMLCQTTLLLHEGEAAFLGDTAEAISRFHDVLGEAREVDNPNQTADGSFEVLQPMVHAVDVGLLGADGTSTRHVSSVEDVTFVLEAEALEPVPDAMVAFRIFNSAGLEVYGESITGVQGLDTGARQRFGVRLQANLASGSYTAAFSIATAEGKPCFRPHTPLSFFVAGRVGVWGAADLRGRFETGPSS